MRIKKKKENYGCCRWCVTGMSGEYVSFQIFSQVDCEKRKKIKKKEIMVAGKQRE